MSDCDEIRDVLTQLLSSGMTLDRIANIAEVSEKKFKALLKKGTRLTREDLGTALNRLRPVLKKAQKNEQPPTPQNPLGMRVDVA